MFSLSPILLVTVILLILLKDGLEKINGLLGSLRRRSRTWTFATCTPPTLITLPNDRHAGVLYSAVSGIEVSPVGKEDSMESRKDSASAATEGL